MQLQEAGSAFFSQVLFELRAAHFHEIDEHQAVYDVGKCAIDVEGQHFAAAVEVLAQEDGNAFAVGLQVGDGVGKVVDVIEQVGQHAGVAAAQAGRAELPAGLDVTGEVAVAAAC